MVQWLKLYTSNAGVTGSISGWGTKILHVVWLKNKRERNEAETIFEVIIAKDFPKLLKSIKP